METKTNEIFLRYGGIMKTSELKQEGLYYRKIQSLLESGEIIQIRRGYYQYADENAYSDAMKIAALFPNAVLCMESALDYYGYTDRTPDKWHLAVDSRSARTIFSVEDLPIHPHFIKEDRFCIGQTEGRIDGVSVKVYDRERTMCDILLYRNKLDSEVYGTAIRRYLNDSERNEAQLMKYAKAMHVTKKVREVFGAWL